MLRSSASASGMIQYSITATSRICLGTIQQSTHSQTWTIKASTAKRY
ncbi:hypothetical protein ISS22_13755 [candidate division KSB1 bacterium]|nr:hypothetical protein [candidate division KSB1 bacterium]